MFSTPCHVGASAEQKKKWDFFADYYMGSEIPSLCKHWRILIIFELENMLICCKACGFLKKTEDLLFQSSPRMWSGIMKKSSILLYCSMPSEAIYSHFSLSIYVHWVSVFKQNQSFLEGGSFIQVLPSAPLFFALLQGNGHIAGISSIHISTGRTLRGQQLCLGLLEAVSGALQPLALQKEC